MAGVCLQGKIELAYITDQGYEGRHAQDEKGGGIKKEGYGGGERDKSIRE